MGEWYPTNRVDQFLQKEEERCGYAIKFGEDELERAQKEYGFDGPPGLFRYCQVYHRALNRVIAASGDCEDHDQKQLAKRELQRIIDHTGGTYRTCADICNSSDAYPECFGRESTLLGSDSHGDVIQVGVRALLRRAHAVDSCQADVEAALASLVTDGCRDGTDAEKARCECGNEKAKLTIFDEAGATTCSSNTEWYPTNRADQFL